MPEPALLGYIRTLVRGPSVDAQLALLARSGVDGRHIYRDELPTKRQTGRPMFGEATRALRPGDVLVVPYMAAFARNRVEIMSGMRGLRVRGAHLWSVDDEIDTRVSDPDDIFKLGEAEHRAAAIWKREQTVNGSRAARLSGRSGRRPFLSPKKNALAQLLWLDPASDKTNAVLAAEIGLSASRLYSKFGRRPPKE